MSYPCREWAMASAAVPRLRLGHGFRCSWFSPQLISRDRGWGTLMRHFLCSGLVRVLPPRMVVTAAQTVLIATSCGANCALPRWGSARRGAIPVAAITVATDHYCLVASSTHVASSDGVHWPSSPMTTRRRRPLREILCLQRCLGELGARQRNWLGGWDRCRACVSTGWPVFYLIRRFPAALRLPDSPITSRSHRRKPCGRQTVKPAYPCQKFKSQNHPAVSPFRHPAARI